MEKRRRRESGDQATLFNTVPAIVKSFLCGVCLKGESYLSCYPSTLCPKSGFHRQIPRWQPHPRTRCISCCRPCSKTCPWPQTCFCCWSFLHTWKYIALNNYCFTKTTFSSLTSRLCTTSTQLWDHVDHCWSTFGATRSKPQPENDMFFKCWLSPQNCWVLWTHTCIWPLCPSKVWFMERLEGAARPLTLPSFPDSNFNTFNKPPSPPQAMYPSSLFQPMHCSLVLLGMAIWCKIFTYDNVVPGFTFGICFPYLLT